MKTLNFLCLALLAISFGCSEEFVVGGFSANAGTGTEHTYSTLWSVNSGAEVTTILSKCVSTTVCDDNIACTTDTCDPAVGCTHDLTSCQPCVMDTDCGVGGGKGCIGGNIVSSGSDGTCNGGFCTINMETSLCKYGCDVQNGIICNECATSADCDDGTGCTSEVCTKGKCIYTETDGCGGGGYKCELGEVYPGGDACTIAVCNQSGEFEYSKPDPYCVPCNEHGDCPDFIGLNGGCMDDNLLHASGYSGKCVAKRCEIIYLVKSCQDNDPCTIDDCSGTGCEHTKGVCK